MDVRRVRAAPEDGNRYEVIAGELYVTRRGIVSERGLEAAPDLVVEVLSPSTQLRDRSLERDRYVHFGVPEYWIVDPDACEVLVYRSHGDLTAPEACSNVLVWRPWPTAPVPEIALPELFQTVE